MNEWPDSLWENERSRMWETLSPSVKDAGVAADPYPCTTESIVPSGALGILAISFFFVATAPLAAMGGWRLTRKLLRQMDTGFPPGKRHAG